MGPSFSAIIPAGCPKPGFASMLKEKVGGKCVLSHSIDLFDNHEDCSEVILVVNKDVRSWVSGDPLTFASGKLKLIESGESRAASVLKGVKAATSEIVAIHDAQRPNCGEALLVRLLATVRPKIGAVPGLPAQGAAAYVSAIGSEESPNGGAPADELFGSGAESDHRLGHVMDYPDGSGLFVLQTPQVYYRDTFLTAAAEVGGQLAEFTDSSALYVAGGYEVAVVPGRFGNLQAMGDGELRLLIKLMGSGTRKKKDKYGGLGW